MFDMIEKNPWIIFTTLKKKFRGRYQRLFFRTIIIFRYFDWARKVGMRKQKQNYCLKLRVCWVNLLDAHFLYTYRLTNTTGMQFPHVLLQITAKRNRFL